MQSIINDFRRKWRFPNCCGSIDGKHIRINSPAHSGSLYRNYKCFFSVVLQAVVDANYRFIAIDVGAFGKESDGGVFSNSNLSRQLENGALYADMCITLPGTNTIVPHVLVGDEAYPLKTYLMRPYPQRSVLGPDEDRFNRRLTNARQVVECAFGILSNRWRILLKSIELSPDRVDNVVKCLCVLHNAIIDLEGVGNFNMAQMEIPNWWQASPVIEEENANITTAQKIREDLKIFFRNN